MNVSLMKYIFQKILFLCDIDLISLTLNVDI